MRQAGLTVAGALAAAFLAAPALAQHCPVSMPDPGSFGLAALIRMEAARYETARHAGTYQSVSLAVAGAARLGSFRVHLPVYRLVRDGVEHTGLGDLFAEARLALGHVERDSVGVVLGMTLPTGNASRDLGMGHVMLMSGVWGELDLAPLALLTRVSYAHSMGDWDNAEHRHSVQPSPLVEPMNRSEMSAALALAYRVDPRLRIRAGSQGAYPLRDAAGAARLAIFAGPELRFGAWGLALEGHLPLLGDPFRGKLALELAVHF